MGQERSAQASGRLVGGTGATILQIFPVRFDAILGEAALTCVRVSSHDQKQDLERLAESLKTYCEQRGWPDLEVCQDLGSGLHQEAWTRSTSQADLPARIGRLVIQFKGLPVLEIIVQEENAPSLTWPPRP